MKVSLKAARINANLQQDQVANKIGVDRTTIGKWENGKSAPSAPQFIRLCGLYGVSVDDIFLP